MLNFLIGAATAVILMVAAIGGAMLAWDLNSDENDDEYAIASIASAAPALYIQVADEPELSGRPYARADYQDGRRAWADADGDCQNTRQETLISEALGAVEYADERRCRVARGIWLGAYTGEIFTDPRDMDIDHLVPLANAHRSGGYAWSAARKIAYANYLARDNHLIAVKAGANRSKGAKGPEDWLPEREEYHCRYAASWVGVKRRWELTATPREFAALQDTLAKCRISLRQWPPRAMADDEG